MRRVFSSQNSSEAHLVRGFLEANGIQAVVQGEALSVGHGELPVTPDTWPSVWVIDEDFDEATALIARSRGRAARSHCEHCGYDLTGLPQPRCPECGQPFSKPSTWTCPTCGEQIEEQFTECWNCAAADGEP
ncbi:MAG TPA: DUF2007 domain-containing protein [Phycisphaerae bacterium]